MIWFKLPSYIKNEFKKSKYLEPIFRDRDYLTSGKLPDMIKRQLDNSRYLIVICSPHSKKSSWVNQEVDYFLNKKIRTAEESDPADYIIPYVLLDEPYDIEDCYPPSLLEFVDRRKIRDEHLSIPKIDGEDARNESWFARLFPKSFKTEKSFARVIACVLGIKDEFDDIWNLHRRMLKRRWKIRGSVIALILLIVGFLLWPLEMSVKISDERHSLPILDDAMLYVNGIGYQLASLDTFVVVQDLPWYFLFKDIPIHVQATFYQPADTLYRNTLKCFFSHHRKIALKVKRDLTFAIYEGKVIDPERKPIEGAIIEIEDKTCFSDENGCFRIEFPVQKQTISKIIKVTKMNYHSLTSIQSPVEPTGTKENKIEIIMIKDK